MSASTEALIHFEPLPLRLVREHVDVVEGLLAQRRGVCFDGELGLRAWERNARALRERLEAMSVPDREEALREARVRLRSPVAGEAEAGAFILASLDEDWDGQAEPLIGKRRDATPVHRGLRVAWELRPRGPLPRLVGERADTTAVAVYAVGRGAWARGGDFPGWVLQHQEIVDVPGVEIALAVFGDVRIAHLVGLHGHAGVRALGWLGVPHALEPLVPLLGAGAPASLVRSVATALFATSGRWFVEGGLPALRSSGVPRGDAESAAAWLTGLAPSERERRHHLGVPVRDPWPAGDEPMSRRWLRAQLGLADSPTSQHLPDALLGVPIPPRPAPTNLAFLPPPPWQFPE